MCIITLYIGLDIKCLMKFVSVQVNTEVLGKCQMSDCYFMLGW